MQGIGSWFAYNVPSALVTVSHHLSDGTLSDESLLVMQAVSPSLFLIHDFEIYDSTSVLMLRRKVCPTETELDDRYSNMINEALEMIPEGSHPEDTIISSLRFERVDSLA
jgi:hypothetical protein